MEEYGLGYLINTEYLFAVKRFSELQPRFTDREIKTVHKLSKNSRNLLLNSFNGKTSYGIFQRLTTLKFYRFFYVCGRTGGKNSVLKKRGLQDRAFLSNPSVRRVRRKRLFTRVRPLWSEGIPEPLPRRPSRTRR